MIKFEKTEIVGWKPAIRGMRNPMNSWDQSDTYTTHIEDPETLETAEYSLVVGEKDLQLMRNLVKGGASHAKFRRMIGVYVDITAPLYWWKEFDTYKVGTVANSCSTMHKLHSRPLDIEDFSTDHLMELSMLCLLNTINIINYFRAEYIETNDKTYWWQMIQLLPTSYNQKRTVMLNYEVLAKIHAERQNHKQDEWRAMDAWITDLPYAEELILGGNDHA